MGSRPCSRSSSGLEAARHAARLPRRLRSPITRGSYGRLRACSAAQRMRAGFCGARWMTTWTAFFGSVRPSGSCFWRRFCGPSPAFCARNCRACASADSSAFAWRARSGNWMSPILFRRAPRRWRSRWWSTAWWRPRTSAAGLLIRLNWPFARVRTVPWSWHKNPRTAPGERSH